MTAATASPATVASGPARAQSVVRNALNLMFSTMASAALGMLFWVIAARLYDSAEVGRASATVSAMALIAGLASLSLNAFLVRFLPRAGTSTMRMVGLVYAICGCTAVILTVAFVISGLANTFLDPGPVSLIAFCLAVVCVTFAVLQDSILTALRRTSWLPVQNIALASAKLILLPVAVQAFVFTPMLFAWNIPIAAAVLVMSLIVFLRLAPAHARATRDGQDRPDRREFTRFMSGTFLNGMLSTLVLHVPPVLVSVVLGTDELAHFYLPWLIGSVSLAVSWNIAISFMVEVTSASGRNREHLRHAIRMLLLVNVGGGLALAIGAPYILALLGSEYAEGGATVLRLIGLGFAVQMIKTLFNVVVILENKVWRNVWADLIRTTLFLAGSYVGLRTVGLVGPALAYLGSGLIVSIALAPATVRGLRALAAQDDAPAGASPARGVAAVPYPTPSTSTGSLEIILVPEAYIDWDRLGRIDTVLMERVTDDGPPRLQDDLTIPMHRVAGSSPHAGAAQSTPGDAPVLGAASGPSAGEARPPARQTPMPAKSPILASVSTRASPQRASMPAARMAGPPGLRLLRGREALTGYRAAMAYVGLVLGVLGMVAAVASPLPPALRLAMLLPFVCLGPGSAVLSLFALGDRVSSWAMAFVLSLAVAGVVGDGMLWLRSWNAIGGYAVLAVPTVTVAIITLLPRWQSRPPAPAPVSERILPVGSVPRGGPWMPGKGFGSDRAAILGRPSATTLRPRSPDGVSHPPHGGQPATTPLDWWEYDETVTMGLIRPPNGSGPVLHPGVAGGSASPPTRPEHASGSGDRTIRMPVFSGPDGQQDPHAAGEDPVSEEQEWRTAPWRARSGPPTAPPHHASATDATAILRLPGVGSVSADETALIRLPGQDRPDRLDPVPRLTAISTSPRRLPWRTIGVEVGFAVTVLGLWLAAILTSSTSDVGEFGLLAELTPPYFIALLLCVLRFGWELSRTGWRGWVLALQTVLLVILMHATVPMLVADPEYAWSYKHIGVIEHLRTFGEITNPLDVYQQWPTFFAVVGHLVDGTGVSTLTLGAWAPVFFDLAFCVPLFAIARTLSRDPRVPYLTVFLFTAVNWVAQDYLAPQAFTYILCLGTMLIMLRWLRRPAGTASRRTPRMLRRLWSWAQSGLAEVPYTSKRTQRVALAVLYVVYFVVVSSHQLSPYVIAMSAMALAIFGLVRPLQIAPIFLGIAILYLVPRYEIADHYGIFDGFSLASLFNRVQAVNPVFNTSEARVLSANTVQFLSLTVWGLAALTVLASLRRLGPVAVPAALAFSPFGLLIVQSYGGEAIYRVFLFSAPWAAFLIATLVLRRSWLPRPAGLPAATLVLAGAVLASIQGAHGQLTFNQFSRAEVEAATFLYDHAQPGSDIVLAAGLFPTRLTANYHVFNINPNSDAILLADTGELASLALTEADMPKVDAQFGDTRQYYLVFSPVMSRYMAYFGYMREGAFERLQENVSRSPNWKLYYSNSDVKIYQYVPPPE